MKKSLKTLAIVLLVGVTCGLTLVGCGKNCDKYLKLEKYSDTEAGYEVTNTGVTFECNGNNEYVLGGSVEKASNAVISGFKFGENETHIVSLKLSANKTVEKDSFSLEVKGPNKTNTFDSTALDGDDYTYLLLAVDGMTEEKGYTITVKWNADDEGTVYKINADEDLALAEAND